jgi:hypothetical protein
MEYLWCRGIGQQIAKRSPDGVEKSNPSVPESKIERKYL